MKNKNTSLRYSIEQVNAKLADRKLHCVGDYVNSKAKTTFRCHSGHEWTAAAASVISGKGCPRCAGNMTLTKEIINERLAPRNIKLTGNYVNNSIISTFRCTNGHEWNDIPRNVLRRKGCAVCDAPTDKTYIKEMLNEQLKPLGLRLTGQYVNIGHPVMIECDNGHSWKSKPYTILKLKNCPQCAPSQGRQFSADYVNEILTPRQLRLVGEYKNSKTKAIFRCQHNHIWSAFPSSVIGGSGCPSCAVYGFRHDIPATLYVIKYETYVKYGISNDPMRRFKELSKNGEFEIVLRKEFTLGKTVYELETNIKRRFFESKIITKNECPDGYTETLPLYLIDELLSFIKECSDNSS